MRIRGQRFEQFASNPVNLPTPSLDRTDRKMLRLLRADGRISNADLAQAIGLSASACLRRLRLLEASGVIRGYTAIIEEQASQARTVVIVQITLERQTEEAFNHYVGVDELKLVEEFMRKSARRRAAQSEDLILLNF